jgi:cold shock CspA family protein
MTGRIKFFSQSKGYGYIIGDEGREYYVTVRDVQGAELPRTGDLVGFEPASNERGLRAIKVQIVERGGSRDRVRSDQREDTMPCPYCKKRIVPRLIVKNGRPDSSVCPHCGHIVRSFTGPCYIATRVFGEDSREVMVLRHVRDAVLKRTALGRGVIAWYYGCAPWLSQKLSAGSILTRFVRWTLSHLVNRLEPSLVHPNDSTVAIQHDSRELGVCAYAPRLEQPFTVILQVIRGHLSVLPRGNAGEDTERLLQSGYLVELQLSTPFPDAVVLDDLMASSEVQRWLEVIQRGVRVRTSGVGLSATASAALEELRQAIARVPAFNHPQPVRTSLELWMHWYSPKQFGSDADEFRDAPVLRRLIIQDAQRYGVSLIEDKLQTVVIN